MWSSLLSSTLFISIICFAQTDAAQKWIKLSTKNYSIQSPAGWTIDSSKQMGTDLILFSPLENTTDKFRENVNVLIQNLEGMNIDLDKYTSLSEAQIKTMAADSKIVESKRIKTDKTIYQKIMYTATQSNFKLKFEQYYYIASKKAYVVTLTAEIGKI